ncbi:MAG: hypothetical protein HYS74_01110 [Parcubacteria group bacterium]|nr:hypothetical protein [Parcubacteria group bacterium]
MEKQVSIKGFVVQSFTEGVCPAFVRVQETQDDTMAACLWLENHGRPEEAETLLSSFCRR